MMINDSLLDRIKLIEGQLNAMQRNSNKYGKYIEELEKDVAILKKDSHPAQEYICCRKCGCQIAKTKIKKRRK